MTLAYYGKSKQRQILLAIVTFFAIAIGVVAAGGFGGVVPTGRIFAQTDDVTAGPITQQGVVPTPMTGNPTCESLGQGWTGFKLNKTGDDIAGTWNAASIPTHAEGSLPAGGSITVTVLPDGANSQFLFSWSSNFGIDAVIVKQGGNESPATNLYVYSPEDMGDSGLGPTAGAQNANSVSHLVFCWDSGVPAPTVTKTAANPSIVGANAVWTVSVQNNSQTAMTVVVNDTDASFGSQTSAVGTGSCAESTGNASPFECTVNGSSTLTFTVTKPATNNTCSPTNVSNQASVTYWDGSSSQTTAATTASVIEIPAGGTNCNPQTLTRSITVCKVISSNSDSTVNSGTFGFTVSGGNPSQASFNLTANEDSQTTGQSPDCATFNVDLNADVTITESTVPSGWTNSPDYPKHFVTTNGIAAAEVSSDNSVVVKAANACYDTAQSAPAASQTEQSCRVTFVNREESVTRYIQVCKDFVDNEDGNDEVGIQFDFTVSGNVGADIPVSITLDEDTTECLVSPIAVTLEHDDDTVTVTETLPSGFVSETGYPWVSTSNRWVNGASISVRMDDGCLVPGGNTFPRIFESQAAAVDPDCIITFHNQRVPQVGRDQFLVCKEVVDNGVLPANEGGTFTINLSGGNVSPTSLTLTQTENGALELGTSCKVATADAESIVTITESLPGGWTSSAGYPRYETNGGQGAPGDSSLEYDVNNCSEPGSTFLRALEDQSLEPLPDLCKVTFFNRTDGRVAAAPKLTIKKVITNDASTSTAGDDTPGQGWNFNVQCGTAGTVLAGPTGVDGSYFFGSTGDNVTCTISEVTQNGYSLVGWTRQDTSNNSVGPNTGATNSVTILMNNDDDNVVTFYNRPLGSITVLKFEVNTPANGWTFTLNPSQACGIGSQQGVTAGNGTYTFTNLPLAVNGCSYTVSETVKPNWEVVGGATKDVTGPSTPGGNAQVTFVNQPVVPTCTNCIPVVIVTPTPVPPTPTVVPPTNTPRPTNTPTPINTVLGERTPGALSTPIAPSTGTGAAGSTSSMNFFMATLGLVIIAAGLATVGASRKRR